MIYEQILKKEIDPAIELLSISPVGGGCINETIRCDTSAGTYFFKSSGNCSKDFFKKEAEGLRYISRESNIKTPKVFATGKEGSTFYLLIEWIEHRRPTVNFWEEFGHQLAQMHQITDDQFGLQTDNYIGRLPQSNSRHATWEEFFICERLIPQLERARHANLIDIALAQNFDRLFGKLCDLLPAEEPSLLHGDLWSGNFLCDTREKPVLIDPAVYYGNRECEIAFTTLFGGFSERFYDCYNEVSPLQTGFRERIDIHNLYPLLVHVNLFGTGYLSGIVSTLRRFT